MAELVLPYTSRRAARVQYLAGAVLIIWASLLIPLGLLLIFRSIAALIALCMTAAIGVDFFLAINLFIGLFAFSIVLFKWGISNLRCGLALLRGRQPTLQNHIRWATVAEIF